MKPEGAVVMGLLQKDFKYYDALYLYKDKPSKGKCRAQLFYYTAEGKRKSTSKVFTGKTLKEVQPLAIQWAKELDAAAVKQGAAASKKKLEKLPTVSEMARQYYDWRLAVGQIEKSTHHQNMFDITAYVDPYIGDVVFVDLDMVTINKWLTDLNARGLAQGTIGKVYYVVKGIYTHYYKSGQIPHNPFEFVTPPRKGAAKVTHLTPQQMNEVLIAMETDFPAGHFMRSVIMLAAYAGLRRGEICGLRWNDVDFETGMLSVTTAIGKGEESYTKNPKNRSSIRTFPMLPQLQEELEIRYRTVKAEWGTINKSWFVCGEGKKYLSPTAMSRHFKWFVDEHGLVDAYGKPITPHGLRHNFASVGIRANMDIASLSLIMGHASRSMTLDTYGDANADALMLASEKLGEHFKEELDAHIDEQLGI